jgi:hypothetical protein
MQRSLALEVRQQTVVSKYAARTTSETVIINVKAAAFLLKPEPKFLPPTRFFHQVALFKTKSDLEVIVVSPVKKVVKTNTLLL